MIRGIVRRGLSVSLGAGTLKLEERVESTTDLSNRRPRLVQKINPEKYNPLRYPPFLEP